jgi:hypothetical protein
LYASDGTTPINASNPTTYGFACKVRADYQAPALISLSLVNGITVSPVSPYPVTVSFTAAQTLSLPVTTSASQLLYDVYLLPIGGIGNAALVRGTISVVGDISRP